MAKILELKQIPVRVTVRHTDWIRFRKELLGFAKQQSGGQLYQPMTHPDLIDIPSHWKECRFEIIRPHIPNECRSILDVGANLGFFCRKFEQDGFEVLRS